MRLTRHRRWAVPIVAAAAVGLTLTACTGDIANEEAGDVDCGDYEQYGTFDGADVDRDNRDARDGTTGTW